MNLTTTVPSAFSRGLNRDTSSDPAFRRCPSAFRRAALPAFIVLASQLLIPASTAVAQVAAAQTGEAGMMVETSAGVNINTATAAELATALSGVGGSKAEAIVRYREQFGPFQSVEELSEVAGIGAATVERNRARIQVQ